MIMGLCLHIFLIDLQDPFTLLNVKNWLPRVVSMVSIYSNQIGRLASATDQYPLDKWHTNIPLAYSQNKVAGLYNQPAS